MKPTITLPNTQYLNECFTYDPVTGTLFWKERPHGHFRSHKGWLFWNSAWAGKEAGNKEFDRPHPITQHERPRAISIRLKINGKTHLFKAHRIVFALMGIVIPDGFEVDHKDTDPFNNSWTNLRLATRAQNGANQTVHVHRKHTHLPKGVSMKRNKFRAQIGFEGRQIGLGSFPTPELAHAAYVAKAQELYGDFSRSN